MKLKEIINYLEKWAPKDLIDSWDNTGFQIGSKEVAIESILIALDLDKSTLERAIKGEYDLIITHHPIIFKPLKSILSSNPTEEIIIDIIKNNIAVYNAHSNLDLAIGGVSDELAKVLNIKNTTNLKELVKREDKESTEKYGYGRIGEIKPISLKDFIEIIKKSLNIENLIFYGDNLGQTIKRVAVCGGSGGSFIEDAFRLEADLYITGDIKYHEAQYAYERGLELIDVGHFHSEKVILPTIKSYLEDEFEGLNIDVLLEPGLAKTIL